MTFNIHAGQEGLDSVARVIAASRADVVGLQEVDVHWGARSGFEDQAAALAAATGMDVRFGPIYQRPGAAPDDPPREYGVAVLSRLPVLSWENHALTRLSTQETEAVPAPMPGFLEVVVDAGGTAVHVFDTHLDYRPDPSVRRTQVAEMLDILGRTRDPVILMGDLNAPPDAPELAPLLRWLRDAWEAGRGRTGARDGTAAGLTYPAGAPTKRIDYVLVSPAFRVLNARVEDTRASDHRPVVASLEVTGEGISPQGAAGTS